MILRDGLGLVLQRRRKLIEVIEAIDANMYIVWRVWRYGSGSALKRGKAQVKTNRSNEINTILFLLSIAHYKYQTLATPEIHVHFKASPAVSSPYAPIIYINLQYHHHSTPT